MKLFWDIETTPNIGYFWRTGSRLRIPPSHILSERKIICICYKWEGKPVKFLTWDKNQCDKTMISKFIKEANNATALIAHNGDRFDLPWFRTRCIYHGLDFPPKPKTIDTLKKARGNFSFNSNKLDYIAQFLGVGEKIGTGGFQLWKDVMDGDSEALVNMVEYCKRDVEILEKVYNKMQRHVPIDYHAGVYGGSEKWTCGHCGSKDVKQNKRKVTKTGVERFEMKCKCCGGYTTISGKARSEYLKYKMRNGKG